MSKASKRLPLADRLRAEIAGTGLSTYRVAKDSGVAQPALQKFVSGYQANLGLADVDRLLNYLGIELVKKAKG